METSSRFSFGNPPDLSVRSSQTAVFCDKDTMSALIDEGHDNPGEKIAVLNFASYQNPGGKFLEGSSAQEESLCHASTLYECLSVQKDYCHMGYGASTQEKRKALALEKPHVNDAYAMGSFHPKHRAHSVRFKKLRRNNRILKKFYDAKYEDKRGGEKKSGSELSCGRTTRSESIRSEKNLRGFRGKKLSSGKRSVRRQRYSFQPYDKVMYDGHVYTVVGTHCNGASIILSNKKSVSIKKVSLVEHAGGYANIPFD